MNDFISTKSSHLNSKNLTNEFCQMKSDVGGPVLINSAPNVQGTNAIWTQVGINSMGGVNAGNNFKNFIVFK